MPLVEEDLDRLVAVGDGLVGGDDRCIITGGHVVVVGEEEISSWNW